MVLVDPTFVWHPICLNPQLKQKWNSDTGYTGMAVYNSFVYRLVILQYLGNSLSDLLEN